MLSLIKVDVMSVLVCLFVSVTRQNGKKTNTQKNDETTIPQIIPNYYFTRDLQASRGGTRAFHFAV